MKLSRFSGGENYCRIHHFIASGECRRFGKFDISTCHVLCILRKKEIKPSAAGSAELTNWGNSNNKTKIQNWVRYKILSFTIQTEKIYILLFTFVCILSGCPCTFARAVYDRKCYNTHIILKYTRWCIENKWKFARKAQFSGGNIFRYLAPPPWTS